MDKYTKVSDKMVDRFGLKIAWVYAKLCYRMNLSRKNKDKYFNNGYFIIFTENKLADKCGMSRGSVIKYLQVLEKAHYVYKDPTLFANHLYLPKYKSDTNESVKGNTYECSKFKHSKEQRTNNKNIKNHVSVDVDMKRAKKYPSVTEIIKTYGKELFDYGIKIYHHEMKLRPIHNAHNFVIGILRCWRSKGIKTVSSAAIYEGRPNDIPVDPNGPKIPIFKI